MCPNGPHRIPAWTFWTGTVLGVYSGMCSCFGSRQSREGCTWLQVGWGLWVMLWYERWRVMWTGMMRYESVTAMQRVQDTRHSMAFPCKARNFGDGNAKTMTDGNPFRVWTLPVRQPVRQSC